ncbi:ATP-binding protein [Blastomonas fulva]|uniref:ATP-binding protein n=1 Tax=Blastomonas fulva TaxID=1550728 RepID=UPI003F70F228
MTGTSVPFEPHFGAFVIESLTLGMYGESRNAIREYIQNSFDSLRQAVGDGLIMAEQAKIEVEMDSNRDGLTIRDNGNGLRTENAASVLAAIGASNKDYRHNAGFRGIGRLAGIVFCDRLIFTTKAKGQSQYTRVLFKAQMLREKLAPEGKSEKNAAETLAECVEATRHDTTEINKHYFEVRLEGMFNPPAECIDPEALRTYISQVAPLPYDPKFPFAEEIRTTAAAAGFPIESVQLFVKDGKAEPTELFKPYVSTVAVKRVRAPLTGVNFSASPTGKWWGWIGRKRVSGAIKDPWKGIRVRIRNIQIDDTRVMREIFAESHLTETPRTSYSRFADWYVGEIFVDPKAAIPNARRDGFEENQAWEDIRNELDAQIATPFGKQAYKTSKADQLSVENLTKAIIAIEEQVTLIEAEGNPTTEKLGPLLDDASARRTRIAASMRVAEPSEVEPLQALAGRLGDVQRRLEALLALAPAHSCDEEVGEAIEFLAQQLFKAFRERLGPQEGGRARAIVSEVTGVKPE